MELEQIESPAFVLDVAKVEENCRLLAHVAGQAECKVLLALKGFAPWALFPMMRNYLAGVTASGIHEALLGAEEFGGEVHVYSPGFNRRELERLLPVANHFSFNSIAQLDIFRELWKSLPISQQALYGDKHLGIRVNHGYSEVEVEIYNPCAKGSRLGALPEHLEGADLSGISGLHFHTLCEQNSDTLERTIPHFEKHFGHLLPQMRWVNFGGGHHITRKDYDVERLIRIIREFRARWGLEVYLEPGEAAGLGTGVLVASVRDIVENGPRIAILDVSATAHMPDILEMPYRPEIAGAAEPDVHPHTYRLGGPTCLAGDVIGDYSFPEPLKVGDKLVFLDMGHYTMVKTTTFNGVPLPDIALWHPLEERYEVVRRYGYEDYKMRLS